MSLNMCKAKNEDTSAKTTTLAFFFIFSVFTVNFE